MNIVFLAHPGFIFSRSMDLYADYLLNGMKSRGHRVEVWRPSPRFYNLPFPFAFKKWLGYIDQYIIFPNKVRTLLKACSKDTLFVFTDHALGPWVKLVAHRPHVIHCHDFLAQFSAMGKIIENPTKWTGKQYQSYIRRGYSKGKNFISVSEKTRSDLHQFLPTEPLSSQVVYNGLNRMFMCIAPEKARYILSKEFELDLGRGYILHVGGNQWYKNRLGVLEIYNAWRSGDTLPLPLLLIGEAPSPLLLKMHDESPFKTDIHFLSGVQEHQLLSAYSGASVLLFPSLAEGFGWPIAEAMASGCPVVTTNEAPMTEVGGKAAFYIPRRPNNLRDLVGWANDGGKAVDAAVNFPMSKRKAVIDAGLSNVRRFDPNAALDRMQEIYQNILQGR